MPQLLAAGVTASQYLATGAEGCMRLVNYLYIYGVVNLTLLLLSLVSVEQSLLPPYLLPLLYQRETPAP